MSKVKAESAQAGTVSAIDRLPKKQAVFCREYATDFNGTQAAIRAGYSERTANEQAARLLAKVSIRAALRELTADRIKRLEIDGDEILRRWHAIMTTDPNSLMQYRRVSCRCCWGNCFQAQRTPSEYREAKLQHAELRAETLWKSDQQVDIGEFDGIEGDWYDKRRDPNPECPECFGEGVGETFFNDTRKLSPGALLMYAGVKEGREGIEILTSSQEKAAEMLGRALGLFKDKEAEVNIHLPAGEELAKLYEEKMAKSRARQEQILAERGIDPNEG